MPAYFYPSGCIFKEDFASERIVAANGGTFLGVGLDSPGVYMPNGTRVIMYDKQYLRFRHKDKKTLTIVAHTDLAAANGSYRCLMRVNAAWINPYLEVRVNNSENKIGVYSGGDVYVTNTYTPGTNKSLVLTYNNTVWSIYIDTVLLGSLTNSTFNWFTPSPLARNLTVGNTAAGNRPWNNKLFNIAVYDYEFTQVDINNYHQQCMNRF